MANEAQTADLRPATPASPQKTPAEPCPTCKGVGQAWQYRTYGDSQYHGQYFERCDTCAGKGVVTDGR